MRVNSLNHSTPVHKWLLVLFATSLLSHENKGQGRDQDRFTASIGTSIPLQHEAKFGWLFTKKASLEGYMQLGIPPRVYIKPLVEVSASNNAEARDYLKANLEGEVGYGLGLRWYYRGFNFDIAYNRLNYRIRKKSSKELVNNLAYDDPKLKEILARLSDWIPAFDDLYSHYLITPVAHAHQIFLSGGRQFPVYKTLQIGVGAGVSATVQSTVQIQSDRSKKSADILLDAVTPDLTKKLESLVNWHVIPTVNLHLIYRFPGRRHPHQKFRTSFETFSPSAP